VGRFRNLNIRITAPSIHRALHPKRVKVSHDVTRLPHDYVDGLELRKTSYVMPWAIYTIPLSSIRDNLPSGEWTSNELELVADTIDEMVRPLPAT
jgi:hypothetical protein